MSRRSSSNRRGAGSAHRRATVVLHVHGPEAPRPMERRSVTRRLPRRYQNICMTYQFVDRHQPRG